MSRCHLFACSTMIGLLLGVPLAEAGVPAPTGTFALASVARIVTTTSTSGLPGYTAAPTPNGTVSAPVAIDSNKPELAPGLFRRKKTYGGEGFIQGSAVQDQDQRKIGPAAGINLKVPLD